MGTPGSPRSPALLSRDIDVSEIEGSDRVFLPYQLKDGGLPQLQSLPEAMHACPPQPRLSDVRSQGQLRDGSQHVCMCEDSGSSMLNVNPAALAQALGVAPEELTRALSRAQASDAQTQDVLRMDAGLTAGTRAPTAATGLSAAGTAAAAAAAAGVAGAGGAGASAEAAQAASRVAPGLLAGLPAPPAIGQRGHSHSSPMEYAEPYPSGGRTAPGTHDGVSSVSGGRGEDGLGLRADGGFERTDVFGRTKVFYPMEEVAKHRDPEDCWLVAHGKVYNVTAFLPKHPAGEHAILRHGGTDSTTDFDFHSSKAQRMWAPYHIGYLATPANQRAADCTIS